MPKVLKSVRTDEQEDYLIFCPGCGHGHAYDRRWTFNGDFEKPTFSPSYLAKAPHGENHVEQVCHRWKD